MPVVSEHCLSAGMELPKPGLCSACWPDKDVAGVNSSCRGRVHLLDSPLGPQGTACSSAVGEIVSAVLECEDVRVCVSGWWRAGGQIRGRRVINSGFRLVYDRS